MWFLAAVQAVLLMRLAWFWVNGRLSQPADWNSTERYLGRQAAIAFAVGAVVSGSTAIYVAMRVPWVDNLPALLSDPPHAVAGREPLAISTAAYLFTIPLALAVFAAILTDPTLAARMRFKGLQSRAVNMRVTIVLALLATAYSVWHSIGVLTAAPP